VQDDFLALLRADRLRTHLRVFIMLVVERHHRDHASAVLLIIEQLSPTVVEHVHTTHETASPFYTDSPVTVGQVVDFKRDRRIETSGSIVEVGDR
jgi:hypothetical protein